MTATVRRATRPSDHRLVAGVAAGVAEHLSVSVVWVRLGFVVATWFNGAGIIVYLLLWRFLPLEQPRESPGLESARRRGLRQRVAYGSNRELFQTLAVCALGVGVIVLLQATGRGVSNALIVPVLAAVLGVAVVWRQIDDAAMSRWVQNTSGFGSAVRIGAGGALIVVAGVYFITQERGWTALLDLGAATVVAAIGVTLILGPWIGSLLGDLATERRERVRAQEREDVAAHLHDSVLQTLALLQKNAHDPAAVATLARRQERDLRAWMYGNPEAASDTLAASLRSAAADVEDAHHVAVEVVAVGDAPGGPAVAALAGAAREAMVNAAKHARVDRVDVYVEVGGSQVVVFVRDRGIGFDPAGIADDRFGIRRSMVNRMERHGGSAEVRSAPGEGTEVRLSMTLAPDEVDA